MIVDSFKNVWIIIVFDVLGKVFVDMCFDCLVVGFVVFDCLYFLSYLNEGVIFYFFGMFVFSCVDGRWIILLSIVVWNVDGKFVFVVVVFVEVSYFEVVFSNFGSVGLFGVIVDYWLDEFVLFNC